MIERKGGRERRAEAGEDRRGIQMRKERTGARERGVQRERGRGREREGERERKRGREGERKRGRGKEEEGKRKRARGIDGKRSESGYGSKRKHAQPKNRNTKTNTLGGCFIHGHLSVIGYMASVRLFPVLAALARWVLFERALFLQRAMAYLHLRESCVGRFVLVYDGRLLRSYFCTI